MTFNADDDEDDGSASGNDASVSCEEFQSIAERSLAGILFMEDKFSANFPGMLENSAETSRTDPDLSVDAEELAKLESAPLEEMQGIHERILTRLDDARKRFNAHEVSCCHHFG